MSWGEDYLANLVTAMSNLTHPESVSSYWTIREVSFLSASGTRSPARKMNLLVCAQFPLQILAAPLIVPTNVFMRRVLQMLLNLSPSLWW
jgi:hypothetical protein